MTLAEDLVVADVETTGPNPFVHDLLSLALVPLQGDQEPLVVHVRFENSVWSEVARRHFERFRHDWEACSVSPETALAQVEVYLARLLGGAPATLIGHNVGFDLSFLKKLAIACGRDAVKGISHRSIDTHTLLYLAWIQGRLPSSALSSDGAFDALRIAPMPPHRHTALGDAIATKALFLQLLEVLQEAPSQPLRSAR